MEPYQVTSKKLYLTNLKGRDKNILYKYLNTVNHTK